MGGRSAAADGACLGVSKVTADADLDALFETGARQTRIG